MTEKTEKTDEEKVQETVVKEKEEGKRYDGGPIPKGSKSSK